MTRRDVSVKLLPRAFGVSIFLLALSLPIQLRYVFGWLPVGSDDGFNEWTSFFVSASDLLVLVVIVLGSLYVWRMFHVKHSSIANGGPNVSRETMGQRENGDGIFERKVGDVSRETFSSFWSWVMFHVKQWLKDLVWLFDVSRETIGFKKMFHVKQSQDLAKQSEDGFQNSCFCPMFHVKHWLFSLWSRGDVSRETSVSKRNETMFHVKHFFVNSNFFLLMGLIITAGVSILVGSEASVSGFRFLKLAEFAGLAIILMLALGPISRRVLFLGILLGGLVQSVFAILQFVVQHDLGMRWLGESVIGTGVEMVAKVEVEGLITGAEKMVRAYGTMPHPNVLAAFLVLAIAIGIYFILRSGGRGARTIEVVSYFAVFLSSVALVVAFSRSGWLALFISLMVLGLMFLIPRVGRRMFHVKHWVVIGLIVLGLAIPAFVIPDVVWNRVGGSRYEASESVRSGLDDLAGEMISERWNSGVGIGGFVISIDQYIGQTKLESWEYQPVHNLFLLAFAETGTVGLIVLILFLAENLNGLWRGYLSALRSQAERRGFLLPAVLFSILVAYIFLMFFDHYFWTLHQGQLLFWILIGVIGNYLMFHVKH